MRRFSLQRPVLATFRYRNWWRTEHRHQSQSASAWQIPILNRVDIGNRTLIISADDQRSQDLSKRMWFEMQKVDIEAGFYTTKTAFCCSASVQEGLEIVRRTGAKSIVSIGTTSISDTAKGIQRMVEMGVKTVEEMDKKEQQQQQTAAAATTKSSSSSSSSVTSVHTNKFSHFVFATEFTPEYHYSSWMSVHNQEDVLIRRQGHAPVAVLYDIDTLITMHKENDWLPAGDVINITTHLFDALYKGYLGNVLGPGSANASNSTSSSSSSSSPSRVLSTMLNHPQHQTTLITGLISLRSLLLELSEKGTIAPSAEMIQKLSEATAMTSLIASQLKTGGHVSVSSSNSSSNSISAGSGGNDVLGLGLGLVETVSLVSAVHKAQHEGVRLPLSWFRTEALIHALTVIDKARESHLGSISTDQGLGGLGVIISDTWATPPALVPSLLRDDESVVCGCAITAVDMLITLLREDLPETLNNSNNNNNSSNNSNNSSQLITPTFLFTTARQTSLAIRESSAYQKQLKQAKKHSKTGATSSDNISPAGLLEGWILTYEERINLIKGVDQRTIVSTTAAKEAKKRKEEAESGQRRALAVPVLCTLRSDLLLDVTEAMLAYHANTT